MKIVSSLSEADLSNSKFSKTLIEKINTTVDEVTKLEASGYFVSEGIITYYAFRGGRPFPRSNRGFHENLSYCHADLPALNARSKYLLNISVFLDEPIKDLGRDVVKAYLDWLYDEKESPWREALSSCIVFERDGLKVGALWPITGEEPYHILANLCMATRLLYEHLSVLQERRFSRLVEKYGVPFAVAHCANSNLSHSAYSSNYVYKTALATGKLHVNAAKIKVRDRGKNLLCNYILSDGYPRQTFKSIEGHLTFFNNLKTEGV